MPGKDHHEKPFDESTVAKLEIFEAYIEAWLPTFIMLGEKKICIFDFFSGTGYDKVGVPGSAIRILKVIKKFTQIIGQKGTRISLYYNEYKDSKFEVLQKACGAFLSENPDVKQVVEIDFKNEEFDARFAGWLPEIKAYPSLVFLDQNGVKFLSNKYFHALEATTKTDFLYFVSSSYFYRFGDSAEFQKYFKFDLAEAKKDPYEFVHRSLIKQLKNNLPQGSDLKLYPFTLKRGSNYHGIVFGAKSPRAVQKFLAVAWTFNGINGEANFDIDDDLGKAQITLFGGKDLQKLKPFKRRLKTS